MPHEEVVSNIAKEVASYSYFGPGPSKLPKEVLESLPADIIEYDSTHVSILELSHRSKEFGNIVQQTEDLVRILLNVPDNYKVLFMQGGGNGQFAAIPLNLLGKTGVADYFVTGTWSEKAFKEAQKYGKVNKVFSSEGYKHIPDEHTWKMTANASYVYYCDNETIEGLEWFEMPKLQHPDIPVVCDMSSNIFSRRFDVSKYGLIFGGAQKNIGCAGITVVIVRDDLLADASPMCPSVLNYAVMTKNNSLFNTPPTFAIHVLMKCLSWIREKGGVAEMERLSVKKSNMVYDFVDQSGGFYKGSIESGCRSRMNVTFNVSNGKSKEDDTNLEKIFLDEASQSGLLSLKGHRSIGGVRVSLYNAVQIDDVQKLTQFMSEFYKKYQSAK